MSSLLIIGGSGFFGKSILDGYQRGLLTQWGINSIYIMARSASNLRIANPELLNETIELINENIATCQNLPSADYVIHAAASSDASRYVGDPTGEKENIIKGVDNFCRLAEVFLRKSKILYVSSGAVYGSRSTNAIPFHEETDFHSLDRIDENKLAYAEAKRASEEKIKNLCDKGLAVSIARCFAFIGKYLPKDQHFAIGNFLQNAINGESIEVKAQKEVYRSYMYADDLVVWLMAICDASSSQCPIYNVGSDEAIEIRSLAKLVGNMYGVDVKYLALSGSDLDFYIPSTLKIRDQLGVIRKFSVADSLKLIYQLREQGGLP